MTRNEKIEQIREHAAGMETQSIIYSQATANIELLSDLQITILLELGDAAFNAYATSINKIKLIMQSTNN